MKENKIKVVTYLRSASKVEGDVLNKEIELSKLLEKHKDDWEVIAHFEDIGCSGRKFEREGLSKLFESLSEVDMVVTISPEMIARDVLVYKDIYQKIESKNCVLYIRDVHKNSIPKKKTLKFDVFPNIAYALA